MTPEEKADEAEVRAALRAAGIADEDFGFFASRDIPEAGIRAPRFDFEAAVPVLVEWLPRAKTALVKERIVRSLTCEKAATPMALRPLVEEFWRAEEHGLKWAIGNALARTKDRRALGTLVELVDDEDVAGHAISALRSLGPKSSLPYLDRARPALERQATEGATPLARRQATAALKRLEEAGTIRPHRT